MLVVGLGEERRWWRQDDGSVMLRKNSRESWSLCSCSNDSSAAVSIVKYGMPPYNVTMKCY